MEIIFWSVASFVFGLFFWNYIYSLIVKAKLKILFSSLGNRQSAKWLLLHERARHEKDIDKINNDLAKLADVEIPDELKELAGKIRFEV